jgi:hypothetical protein
VIVIEKFSKSNLYLFTNNIIDSLTQCQYILERSISMKKITVFFVLIFALALSTACAPAAERPLDNNDRYNNRYVDDNRNINNDGYTDNRTYDQITPNQNIPNTPNNTNYPNNMNMNPNNNTIDDLRTTP